MINSYPTVYAIGHSAISNIFSSGVLVEEKIDGSQFSMGIINGELHCRSKSKQINIEAPEKMFIEAIDTAKKLAPLLHEGWIYRCEYLKTPHHNVINYSRIPKNNLIIFDIVVDEEVYLSYDEKLEVANRLGLECVPKLYEGHVDNMELLMSFLDKTSILGGSKIEGVVVKNYSLFTREKKIMIGKYVSEKFKEVHRVEWNKNNPSGKEFIENVAMKYRSEARWNKAIQHLSEAGELENSPRDIGKLLKEIPEDILKEEKESIMKELFDYFYPKFRRIVISGFPEYYKEYLANKAFENMDNKQ